MLEKKVILFGGTFDPIHIGHTTVARSAAEYIGAGQTVFIPAKCSPLKSFSPYADGQHRLRMIELAIAGSEQFDISDYELNADGQCYTLDTVKHFKDIYGRDTSLYWLIGADSIDEFSLWYKITELIDECNLSVMLRAGFQKPDFSRFEDIWGRQRIEKLGRNVISTPLIDISSTDIRGRLARGDDTTGLLAPAVADYIRRHNLYQRQPDV